MKMEDTVIFEFEDSRKDESYSPSNDVNEFWRFIWNLAASYNRQGIKFKITYYEVKKIVLWR